MFTKLFKYGLKNVLRNKFLSLSSILVIALLIFSVNILVVLHFVSFSIIESVNSKLSINLFLKEEYTRESEDVNLLIKNIESISPEIEVVYKTKEESLKSLKEKNENFWEILGADNPLPDTIIVSGTGIDKYEEVNDKIESKIYLLDEAGLVDNWDKNTTYRNQYQKIQKLIWTIKTLQSGLYVMIFIFVASIFVIVHSVISNFVYYYRDEIHITKLVWGDKKFIYGPFSIQWGIYAMSSTIFSFVLFVFILNNLGYLFAETHTYENLLSILNLPHLFIIELFTFTLLWALSGYFSSRKYF